MLTTILWVGAFFIVLLWRNLAALPPPPRPHDIDQPHPPGPGGRTPG